jgi:hypothetical protein
LILLLEAAVAVVADLLQIQVELRQTEVVQEEQVLVVPMVLLIQAVAVAVLVEALGCVEVLAVQVS